MVLKRPHPFVTSLRAALKWRGGCLSMSCRLPNKQTKKLPSAAAVFSWLRAGFH